MPRCKAPEIGDPTKWGTLWSPLGRDKEIWDPLAGWGVRAPGGQILRSAAHIDVRRNDLPCVMAGIAMASFILTGVALHMGGEIVKAAGGNLYLLPLLVAMALCLA